MKKQFLGLFFSLLILSGCTVQLPEDVSPILLTDQQNPTAVEPLEAQTPVVDQPVVDQPVATPPAVVQEQPKTFDQNMDFGRQAPFGQWENDFYQDGCEEASLIMASKFFAGQPLDETIMKEELDKVEPWELDRFGQNLSVDTESVAIMAREYYGLSAQVSAEVTIEKIKAELLKGNLIILPLLGREINNPNFTAPGPLYHMLVVKGYDRNEFITNDPGTRLGKNYKYPYDVLINATRDWNGGDIYNGQRLMLIVGRQ